MASGLSEATSATMQTKKLFDFNERKNAAEEARKAAAEKFASMKSRLDDPEVQKRMAEQKAIAEARAAREAEKRAAKLAVKQAEEAAKLAAKREAERKAQEEAARRRAACRAARLRRPSASMPRGISTGCSDR